MVKLKAQEIYIPTLSFIIKTDVQTESTRNIHSYNVIYEAPEANQSICSGQITDLTKQPEGEPLDKLVSPFVSVEILSWIL